MWMILIIIVCFFAGCHQNAPSNPNQTIRLNLGADPLTLDPRKARDTRTITVMHMLYEGLTRISKTGNVEMGLADKIDVSEDQLRYRCHLRKSFWSNGDPVTSEDFARSWKSVLAPQFPSDMAYQLYVIKNGQDIKMGEKGAEQLGLQTPDSETLVIELERPVPYFLELLSTSIFFPYKEGAINGPFILESWAKGDQITLKKNPRYWEAGGVQLDQIDLFMVSNDTEIRMFEEGDLDWAGSPLSRIPPDAVTELKKTNKLSVLPFAATFFLRVNTSQIPDPSLRKALALSLNRKAIADHILQGGQTPALGLVPPEMGLSSEGYFNDCDLTTAKALLPHCDKPLTLSFPSDEWNRTLAQSLQKQWEEGLGLSVELEAVEPKIYFRRISQKDYQLAICNWTADFNDPVNFLEVFKYKDASTNNTQWEDSQYIDLLNRSALCKTTEERCSCLREAEAILMDQMPIIPIYHMAMNFLQCKEIDQVALSPLGQMDLRWAKKNRR